MALTRVCKRTAKLIQIALILAATVIVIHKFHKNLQFDEQGPEYGRHQQKVSPNTQNHSFTVNMDKLLGLSSSKKEQVATHNLTDNTSDLVGTTENLNTSLKLTEGMPERTCNETKHLYLLKVHKAGSTTVANVFQRFAMLRRLNVITSRKYYNSFPHRNFENQMPCPPSRLQDGKYDIYCEHSIYDEQYLMTKLHTDTINIAILREPMSRLRSHFKFVNAARQLQIKGRDPVAEFLAKPNYYMSIDYYGSHQNMQNMYESSLGSILLATPP